MGREQYPATAACSLTIETDVKRPMALQSERGRAPNVPEKESHLCHRPVPAMHLPESIPKDSNESLTPPSRTPCPRVTRARLVLPLVCVLGSLQAGSHLLAQMRWIGGVKNWVNVILLLSSRVNPDTICNRNLGSMQAPRVVTSVLVASLTTETARTVTRAKADPQQWGSVGRSAAICRATPAKNRRNALVFRLMTAGEDRTKGL